MQFKFRYTSDIPLNMSVQFEYSLDLNISICTCARVCLGFFFLSFFSFACCVLVFVEMHFFWSSVSEKMLLFNAYKVKP